MKEYIFAFILSLLFLSCTSNNNKDYESIYNKDDDNEISTILHYDAENDADDGIEDGTYTADVDYYNPETGFSNTYTLDVEVVDGQVVEIDFPNGGYLDDSHIDATDIDEDGECTIYDDEGREFGIHIYD